LITAEDAPTIQKGPGEAGALVNGAPAEVEITGLEIPAALVDPEDRTPEQVQEVQRAGAELVASFNAGAPDGSTPLVTITNTDTGAVANGVLVDPRDGTTSVPVPVEDLLLMSAQDIRVLLAAASADAVPQKVQSGVVTVLPSGVVAALAHGFDPSTPGEVVVFSTPTLLGSFTTDTEGTFTGQMTLPADIEPGPHTLVLVTGTVTTSLGLMVEADGSFTVGPEIPGTLPTTGASRVSSVLMLAVMLVLAGVLARPRRRLVS
jgi:hypothetical protein